MNGSLPKGWSIAVLGDVISPSSRKYNPNGGEDVLFIGLEHIAKNEGKIIGYGKSKEIRSTKAVFQTGDLLYGKLRPYLNKVVVPEFDGVCSTDILVFPKSDYLNTRYLKYRLLSEDFVKYANLSVSGVQHPRTDYSKIASFPISLPPLAEQHRIVAKIEELFTRLEAGVAALQQIKQQLKRYRQSVLKHAFEGKLTAEWRAAQLSDPNSPLNTESASVLLERIKAERQAALGKKYKDLPPVDTTNLPTLPEGWVWVRLGECCMLITKGESPKWQGHAYVKEGVPFIRSENVLNGVLDISNLSFVPYTFHKKLRRSKTLPNDVLYNIVGASIGRCAVLPEVISEGNMNQAVALIRPHVSLKSKFLMHLMLSPRLRETMLGKRVEVARPNVSLTDLQNLEIPFSATEEQSQVLVEIERNLSIADAIEQAADQGLQQADRLRQSILKRAFEGKLVPQDPTDEPAEKLLERIKAEREQASTKHEPKKIKSVRNKSARSKV